MAAAKARPRPRPAISGGPRVRVHPFTAEGANGRWTVRWRIGNEGDLPLRLLNAQCPHSQFKSADTTFDVEIGPRAETDVRILVRFAESPGVIVENAFLILRLREKGEWRVLARVRVTAGPRGEPLAGDSVVVTTQRVGAH